jgi:hypothetical protein
MNRTSTAGIGLFLLATLAIPVRPSAPALASPGGDEVLKPSDHDALGKVLAGYVEASSKNKNVDKARNDVAAEIEKFRKRLKDRDPLGLTVDLGKSLWESLAYESAKGVKKGKVAENKYANTEIAMDFVYATWAPPHYDPKKAYPLILCIPDKGEKPMDHLTEKWTSQEIRENVLLAAVPMPEDAALWSEPGSQGKWGGLAHLLTVFKEVSHTYATDFDHVYIAGRGVGVAAAMVIASKFPDRFAGVIGRTGDPNEMPCENFKNLPTFFAGGGAGATAFADKCTKAGYENCTIKPEATEPDVWSWLKDHPRISNPTQVVLLPGVPNPDRVYWLQIPAWDGQGKALVHGAVDRASNTVTIDGEGVTHVSLFFNDVLVDLDKPVKVVCNGAEHTDQIPRNLGTTLDLIVKGRSDPGKLYVATKEYDLPAKPKAK